MRARVCGGGGGGLWKMECARETWQKKPMLRRPGGCDGDEPEGVSQ